PAACWTRSASAARMAASCAPRLPLSGFLAMKIMLLAIWHYRHFILTSIRNDLRTRFARSKLGATWAILQPLAQGAIYALVLGRILGSKLPDTNNKYAYVVYLLGGLLGWTLFAELITRCLTIFVDNASLLKKMVFPRICLPLIVSGSCLLNNLFLLAATLFIFMLVGNYPTWFWLTPIVYAIGILPGRFALALRLNPMYAICSSYQQVLLWGHLPHLKTLGAIVVVSLVLLAAGMLLFRRASPDMVDVL